MRDRDRWVTAFALQVFETGLVHIVVLDGGVSTYETDVPVWRLR
jgi:hypothetical protein